MSDITYRYAEESEAREIYQKGRKCFEIGRYPYSLWSLDLVRQFIAKPNITWVAEINRHIVGFVGAHANYPALPRDHGYMEWCFVLPEYRRQGITSELVKRVEEQYLQLGKRYVVIDTTPDNEAVQKYLRKEGYEVYAKDIFYRKAISAVSHSNEGISYPKHNNQEGKRFLRVFESPENFIGGVLYAIIIAQLLINFDLTKVTPSSILVFIGLLITVGRWCHLYVSLATKEEFQYSSETKFGQWAGFWCSILMLSALFFTVTHQDNLVVVCLSFGGLVFFDLLWELNVIKHITKTNRKAFFLTVKRWITIDSLCILVLAGIVFGVIKYPEWPPLLNLSGAFYPILFFLLMVVISIWDYVHDWLRRLGLYF